MEDKITMTCSSCGKTHELQEYNESGLPYERLRCDECGEENALNPRKINSNSWEWAWTGLISAMRLEFGSRSGVADRMREYIIEKRNRYVKGARSPQEDALEPQLQTGTESSEIKIHLHDFEGE